MEQPITAPPRPDLTLVPASTDLTGSAATTLVVGCGNLLRGDDAVGPLLVRLLAERGVPAHVRLADGGTAGMDVAFAMRGLDRVLVVDAVRGGGGAPGTVYRVPGPTAEQLPPLQALQLHSFRWDHALSFAHWLLKGEYPREVDVWLVEAEGTEPGAPLTPAVDAALHALADRLSAELQAAP